MQNRLQSTAVRLAKQLYYRTPLRSLRGLYFRVFASIVRGRTVIASVDGTNFELDLSELIDLCVYLNQWEKEVTDLIEKNTHPGMTVLDIGANIGAHALRFGRIVGSGGKVFAFEPTDFGYRKLVRNLSLNAFPQVVPIQVALADENQCRRTIHFRSSWRTDGRRVVAPTTVDFERLDDLATRRSVGHVDIIKIDVDGNEFPILLGGRELIQRCRPLFLMEAVSPHFEREETNPFSFLAGLGYRFWDSKTGLEHGGSRAIQDLLPKHDAGMTVSINLVASHTVPAFVLS